MIILAVDTATRSCSVAICQDHGLMAESTIFRRQTHSRHLLEMIHHVLALAGLDLNEIDAFSVTRGPGSFTGLRIGLSCVKGLAYATGKPVISVSSLEALANQAFMNHCTNSSLHIYPVIDARKKEVYFAGFKQQKSVILKIIPESVLPPEKLPLHREDGPCLFIGDGALLYKDLLTRLALSGSIFVPPQHNYIRAHTIALLGLDHLKKDKPDDLSTLAPEYIRKSDAEGTISCNVNFC